MFIGHFAVGMVAKQIKPTLSLGTLFLAAQFLDLLWPTLLLLGIEHVTISPGISKMTPLDFADYPISHSLLVVMIWSLLFGVGAFLFTKSRTGALILAALVLSHWLLDLIVHIPDLPLYPGASPKVGLGMWNSPFLTVLIEGGIFIAGLVSYLNTKKKQEQPVTWKFWSLVAFLIIIYIMNLMGPPPPNVHMIALAGQLQWLFVIWGWWADKQTPS
jgi:hypothetical protein